MCEADIQGYPNYTEKMGSRNAVRERETKKATRIQPTDLAASMTEPKNNLYKDISRGLDLRLPAPPRGQIRRSFGLCCGLRGEEIGVGVRQARVV
jgi:hypothetical protein